MFPQELELYYVIPAIRRELAKRLTKMKVSQRAIAGIFGVTEACVSNYFSSKRGGDVKFSSKIKKLLDEYAIELKEGKISFGDVAYKVCKEFRNSKDLCGLHERMESCSNCSRCLE